MLVYPHISNMGLKIILIYLRKSYHYVAFNISGVYSVLLLVGGMFMGKTFLLCSVHLCAENSVGNNRIVGILVSTKQQP